MHSGATRAQPVAILVVPEKAAVKILMAVKAKVALHVEVEAKVQLRISVTVSAYGRAKLQVKSFLTPSGRHAKGYGR